MDRSLIESGLERIGVPYDGKMIDDLVKYVNEILLFNPVYKLVGDKDPDEIIIRHVLDSAAAYPVFMEETGSGDTIADLGSGAGFPGIVLSIIMRDRSFVLIDRMTRRILFLGGAVAKLKLGNARVLEKDAKDIAERYDAVTCRAFHPLYDIASMVTRIVRSDAPCLFYKGPKANALSELDVLRGEGYTFSERIVGIKVPYLDEARTVCVLRNLKEK